MSTKPATSSLWPLVVLVVAFLAAVTLIAIFVPASRDALAIISPLVGLILVVVPILAGQRQALEQVSRVEKKVDGVETKVDAAAEDTKKTVRQTNGDLHRVIRDTAYESVTRALADRLDTEPDKPPF